MNKKIAIFGGSFNPVHNGHLYIAKQMFLHFCIDKMIIIPTGEPPHKPSENLISAVHRFNMLKLAFADYKNIIISDLELKRTGLSYTYDTVFELKQIYKNDNLYFLVGGDMLLSFNKWKNYDKILQLVNLVCISRDKNEYDNLIAKSKELKNIILLDVPVFPLSSSQIREKIKNKESTKDLLPQIIAEYIQKYNFWSE